MMLRWFFIPLTFLSSTLLLGQRQELSYQEVMGLVKSHHPFAFVADQYPELRAGELLQARGAFDPVLSSSYDQKDFDTKNYWQLWETKLKVPTWYGISAQAGYELYRGTFLDPSRNNPDMGLPSAGLEVSLARGLLMDERRAALRQAQWMRKVGEEERRQKWNELLLKAGSAYWDWAFTFRTKEVLETAVEAGVRQMDAARISYQQGDRPAIDTLDALLLLQDRQARLAEALWELEQARLNLSNFLWQDGLVPMEIQDSIVPEPILDALPQLSLTGDSIALMQADIRTLNPALAQLGYEVEVLAIEKKLRQNDLLPVLNASYNFLYNEDTPVYFTDNYKFGIQFYMPIMLRKERGKLKAVKAKLQQTAWAFEQSTLETRNELRNRFQIYENLRGQIDLFNQMTVNYETILNAERIKFRFGETNIFVINQRELKWIDANVKQADVKRKLLKSALYVDFVAGRLVP